MEDFDPNAELETVTDASDYVRWCADQFNRLTADDETPRSYRTGTRAACWLWVVPSAMLSLDERVEADREQVLTNLARGFQTARLFERQYPGVGARELVVARSVLDCWGPVGAYAQHLLEIAKVAVSARLLVESRLLDDAWDLDAPDVWALILYGGEIFSEVDGDTTDDYSVTPAQGTIDKMTWQKLGNMAASLGAPPPSPN